MRRTLSSASNSFEMSSYNQEFHTFLFLLFLYFFSIDNQINGLEMIVLAFEAVSDDDQIVQEGSIVVCLLSHCINAN